MCDHQSLVVQEFRTEIYFFLQGHCLRLSFQFASLLHFLNEEKDVRLP